MRFSLIIPCYNEADNLPLLLERCKTVALHPDAEVVLVDNGSTDNTAKVLNNLLPKYAGIRSIRIENNQGYGFGILSGLEAAEGEILGWTHADLQTDPHDMLVGLEIFKEHGNEIFVKGRRYNRPFIDLIFTFGMSVFETALFLRPMWDINAQPTMFSRTFFGSWDTPPHDFSLDLYAYHRAKYCRLSVHRFPVTFKNRVYGVSHWNINWASKLKFIRRTVLFSLELKKRYSK